MAENETVTRAEFEELKEANSCEIHDLTERMKALESRKTVTADDLEKRLSETHPTRTGTAVAAKLCGVCGSGGHETGKCGG